MVQPPVSAADYPEDLERLLRWYVAMGVDAAIDETAHDRFSSVDPPMAAPRPAGRLSETAAVSLGAPPAPAEVLIQEAHAVAAAAETIEALHAAWAGFKGCTLATAARMIFAGGNPSARVMILAAAPGSDDEREGEAFAGAAGRLLDDMLGAIGLSRETVYLAHVIPWRPPGNRVPTPLETALCLPFTRRHIALADPVLILCLGERAAQLLLDTRDSMTKLRGRWLTYEGDEATVKLAATFSLDYLLSQPLQKKRAWIDLLAFSKTVAKQNVTSSSLTTHRDPSIQDGNS